VAQFDYPAKLKRSTEGLGVIQNVYSFAMALGLTEVFVGSKTFVDDVIFGNKADLDGRLIITSLMLANVALLGLRFFWVPRNLFYLVFVAAQSPVAKRNREVNLSNLSIAFHLIMIFVHGAFYYLICTEFEFVIFLASSSIPPNLSMFTGYVSLHVGLLLINAAWIGIVQFQAERLRRSAGELRSAGSVWWRNNLVCSLVALAPFSVATSCQSGVTVCMAQTSGIARNITNVLPISPHQLTSVFELFSPITSYLGLTGGHAVVLWVLLVLLINSAYDLLSTGRSYLFFDKVEWEDAATPAQDASIKGSATP